MSENVDIDDECLNELRNLAEKLRAMLDEKLGKGWEKMSGAPAKRKVSILFGIAYADELDDIRKHDEDLDRFAGMMIAGQAGLSADSYGPLLYAGQDLSQHVVIRENQEASRGTGRYKVIETSDRDYLEDQLNEEPGWKLHSFSATSNSHVAVLERQDVR